MSRHVVLFYPDLIAPGGAERLLLEELHAFLAAGWAARIVTYRLDERALFGRNDLRPAVTTLRRHSLLGRLLRLRHYLRQQRPDLIVAHSHTAAWYLGLASLGLGIPYLVHIHGSLFWFPEDRLKYALIHRRVFPTIRSSLAGHREFIPEGRHFSVPMRVFNELHALVDWYTIRRAAGIITLTAQVQWEVEQLYDRPSIVARGCLDDHMLQRLNRDEARQVLGLPPGSILFSVGRLDPRKRIDVAIRAFALVADEFPAAYFVIGGSGEERPRLEKLATNLGVDERVRFVGFIPDEQLPQYYAACDLFIFPSWTSSGITPYEALAQGARVVWTSEACEPVLTDPNVFVADPSREATAAAIRRALATPRGEPTDVRQFSWWHYFAPILALSEAVFASTPGRGAHACRR